MRQYHLGEAERAKLAFPGEYIFSLIKEDTLDRAITLFANFPGKTDERCICYCSSGETHLIFHLPHASCRPVLAWLLKVHQCKDAVYIVVGDTIFEEVTIHDGKIIQAAIRALPIARKYDTENSIVLYTGTPVPESRELHSLIPPPRPVPWKKNISRNISNSRPVLSKRLLIPLVIAVGYLIFSLLRNAFASGEDPGAAGPPIIMEQPANITGLHFISHLKTIHGHIPENVWVSKIEIFNENMDIYLYGKNIAEFLDSLGGMYEILYDDIDITQIFQTLNPNNGQARYVRLPVTGLAEYSPGNTGTASMGSPGLTDKIRAMQNLRQELVNKTGKAIEITENDNRVRISLSGFAQEIVRALELFSQTAIPLLQLSLQKVARSEYELQLSIVMAFGDVPEGAAFNADFSDLSGQQLLASEIQRLFDIGNPPIAVQQTPDREAYIPDHLIPQGKILFSDGQYFSFYDTKNGFTVCLSAGEQYGRWQLSGDGEFVPGNEYP